MGTFGANYTAPKITYGSIFSPTKLGQRRRNGSGLRRRSRVLDVAGTAAIDGTISAQGPAPIGWPASAGGSILLKAPPSRASGLSSTSRAGSAGASSGSGGGGKNSGDPVQRQHLHGGCPSARTDEPAPTIPRPPARSNLQAAGQAEGEGSLIVNNNNLRRTIPAAPATLVPERLRI